MNRKREPSYASRELLSRLRALHRAALALDMGPDFTKKHEVRNAIDEEAKTLETTIALKMQRRSR